MKLLPWIIAALLAAFAIYQQVELSGARDSLASVSTEIASAREGAASVVKAAEASAAEAVAALETAKTDLAAKTTALEAARAAVADLTARLERAETSLQQTAAKDSELLAETEAELATAKDEADLLRAKLDKAEKALSDAGIAVEE